MAFVIALGDYIIPKQLGGTTMTLFGSLVSDQFGQAYNWPLGSALGFYSLRRRGADPDAVDENREIGGICGME